VALIKEVIKPTGEKTTYWKIVCFNDIFPDNKISVGLDGYQSKEDRDTNKNCNNSINILIDSFPFIDRMNPLPELYKTLKCYEFFKDSEDDL